VIDGKSVGPPVTSVEINRQATGKNIKTVQRKTRMTLKSRHMETDMSDLSFSDLSITIEDLPTRAQAMGEEQSVDILGGWGSFRRRFRRVRRSVRSSYRRGRSWANRGRRVVRRAARRPLRTGLLLKARYHSRMASYYRRAAARSPF